MPSRIVREGILTSERVDALTWQAEVLYRRLMSVVDDYGRFYSRPALIRAACFPLRLDRVSDSDIGKWLRETEKAGLVRAYQVEGKGYLELLDFRQQVRAKESKFPAFDTQMRSKCAADVHLDVDVFEDVDVFVSTCAPPAESPTHGHVNGKANGNRGPPKQGQRLPAEWRLPDDWKQWAVAAYPDLDPQKVVRMSLEFRDYWAAVPGAKGRKLDWEATWRNNIRRKMGDA